MRRVLGLKGQYEYIKMIVDVYDIVRVVEVQQSDATVSGDICRVSYNLEEKPEGSDDETSVQHVNVRHSLDQIQEMMSEAKSETPDWM